MSRIIPYLAFNGNCNEAMEFYKECLGGELNIMTYAESPLPDLTDEMKKRILHSMLVAKDFTLMASDAMPDYPPTNGNDVCLYLNCISKGEAEALFSQLSAGGTVVMELADQFWGAYFGMLTDKFQKGWFISYYYSNKKL